MRVQSGNLNNANKKGLTTMPAANHKLTTQEMARFLADGYLRFDALIPDPINQPICPRRGRVRGETHRIQ